MTFEILKQVFYGVLVAAIMGALWFGFRHWTNKRLLEKLFFWFLFLFFWYLSASLFWSALTAFLIGLATRAHDGSFWLASSDPVSLLCAGLGFLLSFLVIYGVMRLMMARISHETVRKYLG